MEALDTRGWKIVPGHLDDWNAKQGSTLRIELRGEIVGEIYYDCARVALSQTGKIVAIEVDGLYAYCLIHPEALRRSQDSQPIQN